MRPLVVTQNITVDGVVEMLDDWFDPMTQDGQWRTFFALVGGVTALVGVVAWFGLRGVQPVARPSALHRN